MRRQAFFSNFNNVPYFTKSSLETLAAKLKMPRSTLNVYIQRALKNLEIVSLKRNYYVTSDFYNRNRASTSYRFYLANALLSPSYISRESALQHYGMLAEAVGDYYTSVSTTTTRKFNNKLGKFEYKSIKEDLFLGFKTESFEIDELKLSYSIALPYKAVFDLLYYKQGFADITRKNIFKVLEDLRIDYEVLSKKDKDSLLKLIPSRK